MQPVRFLPEVSTDLAAAANWYESQRHGLGEEFLDVFRTAVLRLVEVGAALRQSYGEFRYLQLPRFPYLVFFRQDQDGVVVVLVINAARDPQLIRQLLGERA